MTDAAQSERAPLYDFVTFGETMIRFSTPPGVRLESASALNMSVGGSESNVAVALARLGLRPAWVSVLPQTAFGHRISRELAHHGVDVSRVVWQAQGRTGVYYLESGTAPRPTRVLYDRTDSAVSLVDPDSIDTGIVAQSRALHLTGITPALSPNCAEVCTRLADTAMQAGVPLIVDVNYRSRLWSPAQAVEGLVPLLQRTSLLLCGAGDARTLWGCHGDEEAIAHDLLGRTGATAVVVTLAEQGALCLTRDGALFRQAAVPVDAVDPVGAGDAFAAGFLSRWLLDPNDIPSALRAATAMAALKMTIDGDFALTTAEELAELLRSTEAPGIDIVR